MIKTSVVHHKDLVLHHYLALDAKLPLYLYSVDKFSTEDLEEIKNEANEISKHANCIYVRTHNELNKRKLLTNNT